MTYLTFITEVAEQDISQAARYIAQELLNPIAADGLLDEFENAVASLEAMPKRYPLVKNEELAALSFRIMPVQNYLVFYVVREKSRRVVIERFLHHRRDWIHILGE